MHICFVCREYPPSKRGGGIASYHKEMAEGLVALGHRVTVVCASDDTRETSDVTTGLLRVIRLHGGDFLIPQMEKDSIIKRLRIFYRFRSYRKQLRTVIETLEGIDIIEVPEYGAESLYLQGLGVPVVVRLHCPLLFDFRTCGVKKIGLDCAKSYWQGKKEFEAIKEATYISSCSNALAEWTKKYVGEVKAHIKVIANPIDVDNIVNVPSQSCNPVIKNVLYVGTIAETKGCGDLCLSVKRLYEEGEFVQLTMIGKQGSYASWLRKEYGQCEWFNLKGFTPREEIMSLYASADTVVFPSWFDNFPMVCLEAMLCGAIVIGSTSGGMSEIITDGIDGFLTPPHDVNNIAYLIKKSLRLSNSERLRISNNARNTIKNNYRREIILTHTLDYYTECITSFIKERE